MFDQKFEYLNTGGHGTLIHGFRYAVGDTPQPILGVHGKYRSIIVLPFARLFVAFTTNSGNGLKKGDFVKINVTNADSETTRTLFNNIYTVELAGDHGFIIDLLWEKGMAIQGTWQLANAIIQSCPTGFSKNSSGVCIKDTITCPSGQTLINGVCVQNIINPLLGCPTGMIKNSSGVCVEKAGTNLPSWAIWVGLVVVAGISGYFIFRKRK